MLINHSKGEKVLKLPKVSVVMPVRNDERFVEEALKSLLENDYSEEKLEIIVVDGMSTDRTVDLVKSLADKDKRIKLLKNPHVYTPHGLNIGIKNSSGDIVMIAGSHASYSKNYIKECVRGIVKDGFNVVGGQMITLPRANTPKAIAIAKVLSSKFGTGAAYRTREFDDDSVVEVDTVAYALYKRDIFGKVGLFNENLIRNQDIEMNIRIAKNGGKIGLNPKAKSFYYARDTYKELFTNNFFNGFWVLWSLNFSNLAFRIRHIVPLFFVLGYIVFLLSYFFFKPLFWLFGGLYGLYLGIVTAESIKFAYMEKSLKVFIHSLIAFFILHVSYGLGEIWGLLRLTVGNLKN